MNPSVMRWDGAEAPSSPRVRAATSSGAAPAASFRTVRRVTAECVGGCVAVGCMRVCLLGVGVPDRRP